MRGRLKLRTIAVGIAALWSMGSEGGCPFGQSAPPVATLSCASPTIMIEAGGSKPLDNPCSDQGDWARSGFLSDDFGFDFTAHPGITGIEIDKNFDATSAFPPTRTLSVRSTVAPQTITLPFVYRFDDVGANPATFYNGKGELTLIITAPPGTLTAHADAMPTTINSGEESLLLASIAGEVCPPCSVRWFTAPSGNLVSDITNPHVTPTETTQYYFQITDSLGRQAASNTVTVTVRPPLAITTTSLPHGAIGQLYDQALNSDPASAADTWTVVNGAPPPGVNLQTAIDGSGRLFGSPQSSGIFAFTVKVQDANGQTATKDLSITIDNPKPVLTLLTPQSAPVGAADMQLTITGQNFVDGASVTFGTSTFTPSSITPTQILVTIPAGSLSQAGSPGVFVTNPDPGGVRSDETLFFQIEAPPPPPGILVDLVPTDSRGPLAAAIGASGRFAAFWSSVTNLVSPATTLATNLFLRDTCLGVSCSPSTTLVSAVDGLSPPGEANVAAEQTLRVAMSDDANVIGLTSPPTNLVSSPTVHQSDDVFLRYTCANVASPCTPRTVLASVTNAGGEPSDFSSLGDVSPDGRFVAFVTRATDIVSPPVTRSNGGELYLRDTCVSGPDSRSLVPGCTPQSIRLSLSTQQTNGLFDVTVSSGGRLVAFVSNAQGPVVAPSSAEVFLSDTRGGAGPTLTLLSHDNAGNPAFGSSRWPSISADGRFVVFTSDAASLPGGGDVRQRIYRADTSNPSAPPVLLGAPPASATSVRSISADGRFVLFISVTTTGSTGFFVLDTCETTTGPVASCQAKTNLISVDSQGLPVPEAFMSFTPGSGFAISRDGHYALFMYEDANFIDHVAIAATGF